MIGRRPKSQNTSVGSCCLYVCLRHLLESEAVPTPYFSSTEASVVTVRYIATFMRSMPDSFATGRGQPPRCWLHRRGSVGAVVDSSSTFAVFGGQGQSSSGSSFATEVATR